MPTRCKCCNKPLAIRTRAYANQNGMYCTRVCAVLDATKLYTDNEYPSALELIQAASAYVDDITEEISREDYGARSEYFTTYSESHDMCTIFEQVYEGDELICTEVVGWYFGEQTPENDETYRNQIRAVFVD